MDFIVDPGLMLYLPLWKRDGGSFSSDDHCGHLATVNGAIWTPQGRTFDGVDDYISLGTSASLVGGSGQMTVAAWVKPTTISNGPILAWLGGAGASELFNFILLDNPSDNLYFSTVTTGQVTVTSNTQVSLNVWSHVVGRYDGAELRLFINGTTDTAVNAQTGNLTRQNAGSELCIGKYHDGTLLLDGTVGEIRVYNRALTPLEIQHLYLATKGRYQ